MPPKLVEVPVTSTDPVPAVPEPGAPSEPLLTVGTVGSGVTAVLALLVAFAVPLTTAQQVAILGVALFAAPFLVALAGRGRVWSPASVRKLVASRTQPRQ